MLLHRAEAAKLESTRPRARHPRAPRAEMQARTGHLHRQPLPRVSVCAKSGTLSQPGSMDCQIVLPVLLESTGRGLETRATSVGKAAIQKLPQVQVAPFVRLASMGMQRFHVIQVCPAWLAPTTPLQTGRARTPSMIASARRVTSVICRQVLSPAPEGRSRVWLARFPLILSTSLTSGRVDVKSHIIGIPQIPAISIAIRVPRTRKARVGTSPDACALKDTLVPTQATIWGLHPPMVGVLPAQLESTRTAAAPGIVMIVPWITLLKQERQLTPPAIGMASWS